VSDAEGLKNSVFLFSLDMAALSVAKYRGEFEERLEALLNELLSKEGSHF